MRSREEIEAKLRQAEALKKKFKDFVEDEAYYLGIADALRFALGEPLELEDDAKDEKLEVAEAMIKYGGSFVKALGQALMLADNENAQRIKIAFKEYWEKYKKMKENE